MSATDELVAFTVRLTKVEHERLRALAEAEHRTLGAQVRVALIDHMNKAARAA